VVRAIEPKDVSSLLQLIDTAWRIHLRIPPAELKSRIQEIPGFLAEDWVGLRGFMLVEPQPTNVALIVAAGLRDTWSVGPYLDVLLPEIERTSLARHLLSLVYIGHTEWLVQELLARGFEVREWIVAFERLGTEQPARSGPAPARLRTAHYSDLAALSALDELVFEHIWHKSPGNFRAALARADSFLVAVVDDQIVAYAWCELYGQHAHLTRLAVHPEFQGQGIGGQLLYRSITDVLRRGANLITLNTQEHNLRSQALYHRFGFVHTEERMPILWKDL
jgi:ribosomal-protein-alanine N-acetyltransferase